MYRIDFGTENDAVMWRKKSSFVVASIVLMSAFCLTVTIIPENARAAILYVGGSGPGNYTSIQDAVSASSPGDTVYVYNGTYVEDVQISLPITLKGEDTDNTTILGMGFMATVQLLTNGITVDGFNITSMFSNSMGIAAFSVQNCHITNNNISNLFYGMQLFEFHNNVISNNTLALNEVGIMSMSSDSNGYTGNSFISNNVTGVILDSSIGNVFTDNEFLLDGIQIAGYSLEYWNTHSINTSNTVNGKPLQYWKDSVGGVVPLGAGQVIIANSSGIVVVGQDLSDTSIGIQLGFSTEVTMVNNTIDPGGYIGIRLMFSDDSEIHNNLIRSAVAGVMAYYSRNTTISNNTISEGYFGLGLQDSEYFNLTANILSDCGVIIWGEVVESWNTHVMDTSNSVNGAPLRYLKNVTSTSVPPGSGQVILANCSWLSLENQYFNRSSIGVQMGFSSNITVKNVISSFNYNGFFIQHSFNNSFENISASQNDIFGFYFMSSGHNLIANSTAINNPLGAGLFLHSSSNNTISNFTSSDSQVGISIWRSYDNVVIRSNLSSNIFDGISIVMSAHNTIVENTISYNSYSGISAFDSDYNRIYHNNFINNLVQGFDNFGLNQWDDGYPSGGNYWSDYLGVDLFSGPNQDIPGSDSIGDTEYLVTPDGRDRYPLMSPFEMIHPRPPSMLDAILTGKDWENVTISWVLSIDDGAGFDSVTAYDVYRGSMYQPDGSGYGLIDSVPSGTGVYVDHLAGEGNPDNYFYRVCAVGSNNVTECSENQAGKFTRQLTMGTNLVSVPLTQSEKGIMTVLQTVSFEKAWFFDAPIGKWKSFVKSKPFLGELDMVSEEMAIWIDVIEDSNLTVAGIVPWSTSISLTAGWNLIGFPSFNTSYTVGDLKAQTGASRVEGFDGSTPPYYLRELTNVEVLLPGNGYWVWVDTDAVWTVTNF